MATIGSLVVDLTANSAGLTSNLTKAQGSVRSSSARINRSLATVDRRFKKLGRATSNWVRGLVSLRGAVTLAAGAAGLGLLVSKAIDFADTIAKTSDAIGVSTDALQQYRFAADLAGVEQEKLDKGFKKFTRNIGELEKKSNELDLALRDLDSTLLADLRASGSLEEQLQIAFRALGGYADQTKKAAVAQALFGRAGIDVTNIVKNGAAALEEQLQKARELGIVIDEKLLRSAEKAKDQFTILATVLKAQATAAVVEHADKIANLTQKLIAAIPKIAQWTEGFARWIGLIDATPTEKLREIGKEIEFLQRRFVALRSLPGGGGGLASYIEREIAGLKAEREGLRAEVARQEAQAGGTSAAGTSSAGPLRVTISPAKRFAATNSAVEKHLALLQRLQNDSRAVIDSVSTSAERYQQRLELLNRALEAGVIKQAEYTTTVKRLQDAFDAEESRLQKTRETAINLTAAADGIGFAFESAFENAMLAGSRFSDVLQGLAQDIQRLILREVVTAPLAGALSAGLKGAFGGFGGTVEAPVAHTGGALGADRLPTRSLPAALFSGAPHFAGGGMLGPGEIPAVLHRGEAVFTPGQLAALGSSGGGVNVTINDRRGTDAPPVAVSERLDSRGVRQVIVDIMADDMRTRGPASRAIEGAFGLTRSGRSR
jgi:hypothetical protein